MNLEEPYLAQVRLDFDMVWESLVKSLSLLDGILNELFGNIHAYLGAIFHWFD